MKTVDIEDDIYAYLLSKATEFGETATSILRREIPGLQQAKGKQIPNPFASQPHELAELLASSRMKVWNTTNEYLLVLGEACKQKPTDFEKLLTLRGRDRKYFSRSEAEIEQSGISTAPKQIPSTPYWALTNLTTANKQAVLRQALELLNYSPAAVSAAATAIA